MKLLFDKTFWLGFWLTIIGLFSYYIQLTPFIFLIDVLWPRLAHSLWFVLIGLGFMVVGVWSGFTKGRVTVLVVSLLLIGWFIATTFFVYREETAYFTNGDVRLAGTLLVPRGNEVHPAIIIIHGSSPNTRAPFRGLAEHFVRQGVASLTYDKRSFGLSTGHVPYTFDDLAGDVLAGLNTLGQHPQIDSSRIGLIGFSEGGFVGPLAAAQSADVAGLIIISGGGVSPSRTVHYEMESRLRQAGFAEDEILQAIALMQHVDNYYRTGKDGDEVITALHQVKQAPWFQTAFDMPPNALPASLDDIPFIDNYPANLDFDPLEMLANLDIPMRFIFGEVDTQVPPHESADAIRATLMEAGGKDFQIKTFPGADHLILINYQPAPGYLETLTEWVQTSW